ncbi:MAG: hypothetical protein ABEJ04_04605 [Halobacteriaceae archaeon]
MYGVVTRNEEELGWSEFDLGFYEVKEVSGRHAEPVADGVSAVSCFGDTATAETEPDLAPVDESGTPATSDHPDFDWSYVCPSEEPYREGLLETIADCAAVSGDVRLDEVGFPNAAFCHCDRCESAFADGDHDDWLAWRASTVTDFVARARERVPGDLYLTLHPDPYPGHLRRREGVDPAALAEHVDEFVVPLYATSYDVTYWLESLAAGFADELDARFAVELYAVDVDVSELVRATEVADEHADDVLFGYGASNGRAALRRLRAEAGDGVVHGAE